LTKGRNGAVDESPSSHRQVSARRLRVLRGARVADRRAQGPQDLVEEPQDLVASHLWLHVNTKTFTQLGRSDNRRYGWINGLVQY
jgi:hypothetical protein